jgi:hypothetical protein
MSPKDPRDELVEELVRLRSVINAAEARCAAITRYLADLDDGHPLGCVSVTQFLSWQAGLSTGAAKALIEVGDRLGELPSLAAAAEAGEVSVWQARAIASAAVDDDEAAGLVEIARYSTCSQLETACRHIARTRAAGDDREQAAHRARRLRTWWSAQGTLRVDGELGVEAGAVLRTALDRAVEELPDDVADDAEDRQAAWQADGLELLARAFLDSGDDDRSSPSAPPGHLSVHIGLERLVDRAELDAASVVSDTEFPEPDPADGPTAEDRALAELCRLGWHGPGVADALVRRLCCDATIQAVVRDPDGNPLALGRRVHLVTPRLRRALYARDDGCCQAPGCDAHRFLHAHHLVAWADGGPTELANLALLCSWHHRMVHDGLLVVTMVDGRPEVSHTRPPPSWRPPPIRHVLTAAAAAGVTPRPDAATSRWEGDSIDYACFDAAFLNRPQLN